MNNTICNVCGNKRSKIELDFSQPEKRIKYNKSFENLLVSKYDSNDANDEFSEITLKMGNLQLDNNKLLTSIISKINSFEDKIDVLQLKIEELQKNISDKDYTIDSLKDEIINLKKEVRDHNIETKNLFDY